VARNSVKALVRRRQRERATVRARARFLDLQLVVMAPNHPAPIIVVGGRWDDRYKRFLDEPVETEHSITVAPSQVEIARVTVRWLRRNVEVRRLMAAEGHTVDRAESMAWGAEEPIREVVAYGGRRAGKTFWAVLLVALFAVAVPGCRVVMVSPLERDTAELHDALCSILPSAWRTWQTAERQFTVANGARVELRTGRKKQLKLGPTDLAVFNEAQELEERPRLDMLGNLADRGGMLLHTCNPPRRKAGRWIQELVWNIRDQKVPAGRRFFLDWQLNPHTNHRALLALAAGMNELERRREIDGDMDLPVGDILLTSFGNHNILATIPLTWRKRDVTREVLEAFFGVSGCVRLLGLDFDKRAGCAFTSSRFFLPFRGANLDQAIMVVEYGRRYAGHPESSLDGLLRAECDQRGRPLFNSDTTLIVADASGRTQSTERTARRNDRRSREQDPPSWRRLRNANWTQIIGPDPTMAKNPRRRDRFDATRDCLRVKSGRYPRVMFVAATAADVIESARLCPTDGVETGNPNIRPKEAHLVDTWSYPVWRRWGADYLEMVHQVRGTAAEWIPLRGGGHAPA